MGTQTIIPTIPTATETAVKSTISPELEQLMVKTGLSEKEAQAVLKVRSIRSKRFQIKLSADEETDYKKVADYLKANVDGVTDNTTVFLHMLAYFYQLSTKQKAIPNK